MPYVRTRLGRWFYEERGRAKKEGDPAIILLHALLFDGGMWRAQVEPLSALGRVIVVDPGMVSGRDALLGALAGHGPGPDEVTDVVFSHHHPDHTVNAALFPAARIHDHWAMYVGDRWVDRDADGLVLAPSVRLLRTPGHTAEDISTVAATPSDVVVCTHAWWAADGPPEDPLAADPGRLHASRDLLLTFATLIVPGHGAPFRPDQSTPR